MCYNYHKLFCITLEFLYYVGNTEITWMIVIAIPYLSQSHIIVIWIPYLNTATVQNHRPSTINASNPFLQTRLMSLQLMSQWHSTATRDEPYNKGWGPSPHNDVTLPKGVHTLGQIIFFYFSLTFTWGWEIPWLSHDFWSDWNFPEFFPDC